MLLQYCRRPLGCAPTPTPATGATSTWLGTPSAASVATFTSWYRVGERLGSITHTRSGLHRVQPEGWGLCERATHLCDTVTQHYVSFNRNLLIGSIPIPAVGI
jgi:hypothetical protein